MLILSYNTISTELANGFDPASSVRNLSIKDNFLSGSCRTTDNKVIVFGLGEFPAEDQSASYSVGTGGEGFSLEVKRLEL
jgi:hypothetical protein